VPNAETRLRTVVETAVDGIILIDAEGLILTFNPACERLFGYRACDVIGQNVGMLMPSSDPGEHGRHLQTYQLTGEHRIIGISREVRGRRIDGTTFPMALSVGEAKENGRTVFVGNIHDLTALKKAEADLKHKVEELKRSNDELRQFVYIGSHDLQEPLRMVASYTQLLAKRYKGVLGADADEFIAYAVDGVVRMQQLIRALLSYSRVGLKTSKLGAIASEEALQKALANLRSDVEARNALITYDPLPVVMADETQLVELFQQLLGNGIKYGSVAIPRVHIHAEKSGAGMWMFSFKDNGIGIDSQYFERIFAVFQRLHGREEFGGTGMGLAICKKIVEQHGGTIWVESEPGEGSTFCFTLTAAPAHAT
jgi:PAS domain S-box-containing protein